MSGIGTVHLPLGGDPVNPNLDSAFGLDSGMSHDLPNSDLGTAGLVAAAPMNLDESHLGQADLGHDRFAFDGDGPDDDASAGLNTDLDQSGMADLDGDGIPS